MKIRLINRKAPSAEVNDSLADNIFTNICEDIRIQSPMIARPKGAVNAVMRPKVFGSVRRLRRV